MSRFLRIAALLCALMLFAGCGSADPGRAQPIPQDSSELPFETDSSLSEREVFGERRVSLLAVGDNIIHDAIISDARKRADAAHTEYNFFDMYADVADDIAAADIAFVNQEAPISPSHRATGYPDFNSPEAAGKTLAELGFDVVSVANNHMLDMGETGYKETLEFWRGQDVLTIGGYTKQDYDEPRVVEVNGVKIAFLCYTTLINWSHQNSLSSTSDLVVPYAREAVIKRQVEIAKQNSDVVVVSMHWGTEDQFAPDAQQKALVKIMAECGVDLVIGHHPHVIQKIEQIERSDGGNMLVVYSLGNFISTMHYSQNMLGGMVTLDLVVTDDGDVSFENVLLTPIVTHYSLSRDSLHIYKFEDYSEELAKKHGSTLKNDFNYSILRKYITNNISSEYLPEFLK